MKWIMLLVGAGVAAILWFHFTQPETHPVPASVPVVQSSPVQPSPSPTIQYPVSSNATEPSPSPSDELQSVPSTVAQSDPTILDAFDGLFGKKQFESLFILQNIIRRIVVTVDNATKHKQTSQEFTPLKPLDSTFVATGKDEDQQISPENFQRYQPYVELVENMDAHKFIRIYRHYYPLFQAAYEDLGTKNYFNDRLIEVVDHILATPDVQNPIRVVQMGAHGKYKYADDQIEELSSSQKVLIRMGNDSAQVIKAKLKLLRVLLTHLG
jgi:hypothetical protein